MGLLEDCALLHKRSAPTALVALDSLSFSKVLALKLKGAAVWCLDVSHCLDALGVVFDRYSNFGAYLIAILEFDPPSPIAPHQEPTAFFLYCLDNFPGDCYFALFGNSHGVLLVVSLQNAAKHGRPWMIGVGLSKANDHVILEGTFHDRLITIL